VQVPRLGDVPKAYREVLTSMHATEPQRDSRGSLRDLDETTRISDDEGMALFSLAQQAPGADTLEIGLAYGFSTVYLLAAHHARGTGSHTAVDPYQDTDWHGMGLACAERLVRQSSALTTASFCHIPERSEHALVDLDRGGRRFGLTFIDGYHRFDDVLVDFTLAARLTEMGGFIVLHDMWLDSIAAVAGFVRCNRADFAEVDTGCENLFAVRRVGDDTRNWDHFRAFPMR
jgi:predicted O-methyltransferase YrrM